MPYEDKVARVNEVIHELGLDKVKDSMVGNWAYRGVSGGERRRVSIAMEVNLNPSVVFSVPISSLLNLINEHICLCLLYSFTDNNIVAHYSTEIVAVG